MADPISIFPAFVRNQVFPPTPTAAIGVDIVVTLEETEYDVAIAPDELFLF